MEKEIGSPAEVDKSYYLQVGAFREVKEADRMRAKLAFLGLIMEINWVIIGWLIDMTLNGFVWLIIAAFSLLIIDVTDKWTRKAVKLMGKADDWIRKFIEDDLFEFIQKKNLKTLTSIILLIIFGILAQLGIIPKLIT